MAGGFGCVCARMPGWKNNTNESRQKSIFPAHILCDTIDQLVSFGRSFFVCVLAMDNGERNMVIYAIANTARALNVLGVTCVHIIYLPLKTFGGKQLSCDASRKKEKKNDFVRLSNTH